MTLPVSIYIPAFNVETYIGTCIECIQKQTHPISEIVVIDDGSTDKTLEIVKQYVERSKAKSIPVKSVHHEKNRGLAAVRNTGIQSVTEDYVASLDADCLPEPDWLERLMKYFDKPGVAGVSGKLIEKYQKNMPDRWRAVHMKQYWEGIAVIINPVHLFGNNTVFYKPALADIGFYKDTPEYRTNNEDYYISRQLLEKGYTIIYDPDAIVYHLRKDSFASLFRTYWRWFFLHRPRPNTKRGLWDKAWVNFEYFRDFLRNDLETGEFRIIPADFLFLLYQEIHDFRYAIQERRKRRSKLQSNPI